MKSHFRKLFHLLRTHKRASIKVGFLVTVHSAAFMAIPYLFKGSQIVSDSEYFEKHQKSNKNEIFFKIKERFFSYSLEKKFILFFSGCLTYLVFLGGLTKVRFVHSRRLEDLFTISLRKKIFTLLFNNRKNRLNTNIVVQKTMNDVNLITTSLAMSFINILRGTVFATGGILAIAYYFPEIGILTVFFLAIFALRTSLYYEKIQKASKDQIDYLENISKELGQFSAFRKSIFLSQSQNFSFNFFSLKLYKNHEKLMKLADLRGKHLFFLETFGIGYILSIICYGTYLIANGTIIAEDLALSIFALYAALGIRSVNSGLSDLKEKNGILESMEEYFQADLTQGIEEFNSQKNRLPFDSKIKNSFFLSEQFVDYLKFEQYVLDNFEELNKIELNVDNEFQKMLDRVEMFLKEQRNPTTIHIKNLKINEYVKDNNTEKIVVENLTLTPGKCLGLKGRSGIGKTSLVDMINKFREIEEGEITFETSDKNKEPRTFYFTQIPEIFERNFIFNIVISNIDLVVFVLGMKNLTPEQKYKLLFLKIKKALTKSYLWYKIEKNHGSDYLNSLSAGEKQKLIFSRLFFSNCDIIFLDESVSNLDFISKNLILQQLKVFLAERTSLFISHSDKCLESLCGEHILEIKH